MTNATTLAILAVGVLAGCASSAASEPDLEELEPPAAAAEVTTLGILGDSMSLGVNACQEPGQCAQVSWSGGSDPAVGGNDACKPTLEEMTPVGDYEAQLTELFGRLNAEAPDATILALSIPDLYRLWNIGRADPRAVQTWNSSPSCSNLLGDADDDSAEATARRDAVAARIDEFNAAIARVCAAAERCIDDGGAVFGYDFSAEEISSIDFFHPSVAGQRVIAQIAWEALEGGSQ